MNFGSLPSSTPRIETSFLCAVGTSATLLLHVQAPMGNLLMKYSTCLHTVCCQFPQRPVGVIPILVQKKLTPVTCIQMNLSFIHKYEPATKSHLLFEKTNSMNKINRSADFVGKKYLGDQRAQCAQIQESNTILKQEQIARKSSSQIITTFSHF